MYLLLPLPVLLPFVCAYSCILLSRHTSVVSDGIHRLCDGEGGSVQLATLGEALWSLSAYLCVHAFMSSLPGRDRNKGLAILGAVSVPILAASFGSKIFVLLVGFYVGFVGDLLNLMVDWCRQVGASGVPKSSNSSSSEPPEQALEVTCPRTSPTAAEVVGLSLAILVAGLLARRN